MANLNKVMLIGNVVADLELRYTPKGTAVTDIRMAVNRQWTNDQGERQEETTFVDVTLWGRQAEVAGKYLSKGRPVFIEGRLHMDTWEDKNTGQNRSRLKVVGERMQFLGSGGQQGGGQQGGGQQGGDQQGGDQQGGGDQSPPAQDPPAQPSGGTAAAPADFKDDGDDEIPF